MLIRADASAQSGAGHLLRCLALAQALQARGAAVSFLSRCESEELRGRIESAGFGLTAPAGVHPDPADLEAVVAAREAAPGGREAASGGRPWLVLDGYHFDAGYQRQVRRAGYRLLVLDDNAHLPHYHADVVLNQNPVAERLPYSLEAETLLLGGARYALLRREFTAQLAPRREPPEVARRFLVTLGGADPANATLLVMQALEAVEGAEAVVVLGPANPHGASLEAAAARMRTKVRLVRSPANLPELMAEADVAVSAAGGTCWELAYLGVPTVLLTIADNQQHNAAFMAEAGAAISLGPVADLSPEDLAQALSGLTRDREARSEMSRQARSLIDGHGPDRVIEVVAALSGRGLPPGRWRLAEAHDALPIWRIANDPQVRANSFSTAPIPLEDHLRWYHRKLAAPETRYWVYDIGGAVAAQIRYDRTGDGVAELHFSVSPAFRGRGLGTEALRTWPMACRELDVNVIEGRVLEENVASARAFRSAGYEEVGPVDHHGRRSYLFRRTLARGAEQNDEQA